MHFSIFSTIFKTAKHVNAKPPIFPILKFYLVSVSNSFNKETILVIYESEIKINV